VKYRQPNLIVVWVPSAALSAVIRTKNSDLDPPSQTAITVSLRCGRLGGSRNTAQPTAAELPVDRLVLVHPIG
jgi:hypothetical protein